MLGSRFHFSRRWTETENVCSRQLRIAPQRYYKKYPNIIKNVGNHLTSVFAVEPGNHLTPGSDADDELGPRSTTFQSITYSNQAESVEGHIA